MGYDLHITRKENWFDEDNSNDIPLAQWTDYVKGDPEMRLDNYAEAKATNGEQIRIDSEGLSVWTKYSGDGLAGNHAWFMYSQGNVVVKNPDTEIRNKMIDIAELLTAKVQGDDGELYDTKEDLSNKRPWWKVWR